MQDISVQYSTVVVIITALTWPFEGFPIGNMKRHKPDL